MSDDPRLAVFLSRATPDVFRSVLGADDMWRSDPFDVPEIHADVRATFDTIIDALVDQPVGERNVGIERRTLVIRGDAGTGKTHLMRALRAGLHERARGFFAYMQMTTRVQDYARYVLFHTLESLGQPYNVLHSDLTGLEHISRSLVDEARQANIVVGDSEDAEIHAEAVSEGLQMLPAFEHVEPGILTALLLLQRKNPVVTKRAIKYLRCDPLTERERDLIGGLFPLLDSDVPSKVIRWLADIIAMTYGRPLVICIDQLDAFYVDAETAGPSFRAAIAALLDLTEHPNIVIVISALTNYYDLLTKNLTATQLQRLEFGFAPVTLKSTTTPAEVGAVLAKRLAYLYERADAAVDPRTPLYPFAPNTATALAGPSVRLVLHAAGDARETAIRTGKPPTIGHVDAKMVETEPEARALGYDQAWNDHRSSSEVDTPDEAALIATLVSRAVTLASRELPPSRRVAVLPDGEQFLMTLERTGSDPTRTLVGVVNQRAQGGSLARAAIKLEEKAHAKSTAPVLLRTDAFPRTARTKIAATLGEIVTRGGRLVAIPVQELGAIASFMQFDNAHHGEALYSEWLRRSKPLTSLPGMVALLELESIEDTQEPVAGGNAVARDVGGNGVSDESAGSGTAVKAVMTSGAPTNDTSENGGVTSATTMNGTAVHEESTLDTASSVDSEAAATTQGAVALNSSVIDLGARANGTGRFEIVTDVLKRHTAIFGGAGSGKTTLAFSLLENALLRGIPAIIVDRKGDLVSFADPEAWTRPVDSDTARRRDALRERLDIALYTPGSTFGRNLSIATLPSGLGGLRQDEREDEARDAAAGIASLVNWGPTHDNKRAVLGKAIAVYLETIGTSKPTLGALIDFIDDKDPSLMAEIGKLNPSLLDKVVQDLETMRINAGPLVDGKGETINVPVLLGAGSATGKTRLTIVSTKFLGDQKAQLFWVSRLLSDLGRYASASPKPTLQALVFFDEADVYLPATSKPPTKLPMENLLKRARSAGIGMVLATQSPGDLDYKSKENITTWLIGRVNQPQALKKLEDVFGATGSGALAKVPTLTVGNFYGISERVRPTHFVADRPAIEPVQLDERRIEELAHQLGPRA